MASTSSGSVSSTCPSASITSDIGPPYRGGRTSISTKIESLVVPSRAAKVRKMHTGHGVSPRRHAHSAALEECIRGLAQPEHVLRDHVAEHLERAAVNRSEERRVGKE